RHVDHEREAVAEPAQHLADVGRPANREDVAGQDEHVADHRERLGEALAVVLVELEMQVGDWLEPHGQRLVSSGGITDGSGTPPGGAGSARLTRAVPSSV